jgi:hypothetical protein
LGSLASTGSGSATPTCWNAIQEAVEIRRRLAEAISDAFLQDLLDSLRVGGNPAEFEGRLRAAEAALKRLPNYRSYLACGDAHCSSGSEAF